MALFTFTSVVQILDYVDKNLMNTHYFRCPDLNKFFLCWFCKQIELKKKICEEMLVEGQNIIFEYIFYNRIS